MRRWFDRTAAAVPETLCLDVQAEGARKPTGTAARRKRKPDKPVRADDVQPAVPRSAGKSAFKQTPSAAAEPEQPALPLSARQTTLKQASTAEDPGAEQQAPAEAAAVQGELLSCQTKFQTPSAASWAYDGGEQAALEHVYALP